jgi:hypothetical protein
MRSVLDAKEISPSAMRTQPRPEVSLECIPSSLSLIVFCLFGGGLGGRSFYR